VTGSNKGIGFAIVRSLCKKFDGHVYLTARDVGRGENAVKELEKEGLHPHFHQLDIEDTKSITALKDYLVEKYGGLDLLVNNAGIAYKTDSTAPFSEQAEVTLKCNYWGLLDVCKILFPILKPHARVVHLSSSLSFMSLAKCSAAKRSQLFSCQSVDELSHQMNLFVSDVKAGVHQAQGWPDMAYGVSKAGVTLLTPIQQNTFDKEEPGKDIVVNSCCPGYVATDMSSHMGFKTIDQGAVTPVYLALLPPNVESPRGEFLSECQVKALNEENVINYKTVLDLDM
ncbi:hypothetical protein HELRODRAFT_70715, partial [Helobdella robusta]|uniref:carbonyl reductase (NADPH) n=1 Tax=Helobdella robusta TaxID=6412 RepID=T1G0B1_HELRO